MKRLICLCLLWFMVLIGISLAVEITAQKNVAYTLKFPMLDANGDAVTGVGSVDDCEYSYRDAAGAWSDFANLSNYNAMAEDTGAGDTNGWYTLVITQGEMNHDWIVVSCRATDATAKEQRMMIRTIAGNPLNTATLDDATAAVTGINATSGAIDTVTTTTTATTATTCTTASTCTTIGSTGITAIWDKDISAYSGVGYAGTYLKFLKDNTTGDSYALLNTAVGEPAQGAPNVSLSPVDKIRYIYKFMRNKITQTDTTTSIYNDAGDTVDHKSTVGDSGTVFTRDEWVTGP